MSLVKYEPWRRFERLHNNLDRAFAVFDTAPSGSSSTRWVPAVDISEYKDRYVLALELPGIAAEDVEITLHEGVLEVKGERLDAKTDEEVIYRRSERRAGSFQRRFQLPDTADTDKVEAANRNGVLEITIAKQEKAKPKRIEVAA